MSEMKSYRSNLQFSVATEQARKAVRLMDSMGRKKSRFILQLLQSFIGSNPDVLEEGISADEIIERASKQAQINTDFLTEIREIIQDELSCVSKAPQKVESLENAGEEDFLDLLSGEMDMLRVDLLDKKEGMR